MSFKLLQSFLFFCLLLPFVETRCECLPNGICNNYGGCDCFEGWQGSNCQERQCPSGPAVADIPSAVDTGHNLAICSGKGICNTKTGDCICASGFYGDDCSRMVCGGGGNCNGRGQCVSLRTAAQSYDGYRFNRTTVYNLWDADIIHGCKCDPGWGGYDCSERLCEYGVDPRKTSSLPHETVTLVCKCYGSCDGKFKLRFMGTAVNPWLYPSSRGSDIAKAIMSAPGIGGDNSAHAVTSIIASNFSNNDPVCGSAAITKTLIQFRRNGGDMPSISFYANALTGGSIYFETYQSLICDCTESRFCNGTFHLSFDGEMSSRLFTWHNISTVMQELNEMKTIQGGGITVTIKSPSSSISIYSIPICKAGFKSNHTIIMKASAGNIPRIGLWSSVIPTNYPAFYTSSTRGTIYSTMNSSSVLSLVTNDGRDDNMKLCNGIGKCNFEIGQCICPPGWKLDPDNGPCAQVDAATSKWSGIGRCPGIIEVPASEYESRNLLGAFVGNQQVVPGVYKSVDMTMKQNYPTRMFISINPVKLDRNLSTIEYFNYTVAGGPSVDEKSGKLFMTLTSNTSAGPLIIDSANDQLFFIDQHRLWPFIGVASLHTKNNTYRTFLAVNYRIFGFTSDARPQYRKLYWTVPSTSFSSDGAIYWAYMDAASPIAYSLTATIGQSIVIDPMGIAIHLLESKIYWVDKKIISGTRKTVLRACKIDGTSCSELFVYTKVQNQTVSSNATDLVIDFSHNNTAFFIDTNTDGAAIIATNLDSPSYLDNFEEQFDEFKPMRLVCSNVHENRQFMQDPTYLNLDPQNGIIVWSDPPLLRVRANFYTASQSYDPNSIRVDILGNLTDPLLKELESFTVFRGSPEFSNPSMPIGMAFDYGLGLPQWGEYLDCYGHGTCMGMGGNWECECHDGYFGDCQLKTCPKGPAWFHEPAVDNIAHDELLECSNMGSCNRNAGICTCNEGFEGQACERMSCASVETCNEGGRCLSMRDLARKHKNEFKEINSVAYGASPHNPLTWDSDMIYGCSSDEYGFSGYHNITSYVGYDLSQQSCPYGPTRGYNFSVNQEIQKLSCNGLGGYFIISFRGQKSNHIPANSTKWQFQNLLQSITTVGSIDVVFIDRTTGAETNKYDYICAPNYMSIDLQITFTSQVGLVPLLLLDSNQLNYGASVTFSRIQQASPSFAECSNKGTCDRATGICSCFPGWTSSNGAGSNGVRGDCGAKV